MYKKLLSLVCACLFIASCATKVPEKFTLMKVAYHDLPGWENDNHSEALEAFKKSCAKIKVNPQSVKKMPGGFGGNSRDWALICSKINSIEDAKTFFEANFNPYLAARGNNSKALFTGYFETELNGSREKGGAFVYPIYRLPRDLKPGAKYYTREEIEKGALNGENLEIVWVDDPVRLFFMHVQGSGRIKLDDGNVLNLGFAGKNNQEYFSIGKYIAEREGINPKDMSKERIEVWLKSHPSETSSVLQKNQSYIFFRETGGGAIGGQGVVLTPERSLAVDSSLINYGTPIWVDSSINAGKNISEHFQRLLIAQDTGSAIKGPLRLDIFFGYGKSAEEKAGYQNSSGRYFLLLPKGTK